MKNELISIQTSCKDSLEIWKRVNECGLETLDSKDYKDIEEMFPMTSFKKKYRYNIDPFKQKEWTVELYTKNGKEGIIAIQSLFMLLAHYVETFHSFNHKDLKRELVKYESKLRKKKVMIEKLKNKLN